MRTHIQLRVIGLFITGILYLSALSHAQDFVTVSYADLSPETTVKGVYTIQLGDESGNYLHTDESGNLVSAPLDLNDESFYFWILENANKQSFQLHSAGAASSVVKINSDHTAALTDDFDDPLSHLLLRMDPSGPLRSEPTSEVAIGSIVTDRLELYDGEAACECHGLKIGENIRFIMHKASFGSSDYVSFPVAKANADSENATVNQTERLTSLSVNSTSGSENFVSSLFFVNDIGADDFEVTVSADAEGMIGFLDYTDQLFPPNTYQTAVPKIGLRVVAGEITLIIMTGDQMLPSSEDGIPREMLTGFSSGLPIYFGFKDQHTLSATQGEETVELPIKVPAEHFMNQSIIQFSRLLVKLDAGQIDLAYSTKNGIINSSNNQGNAVEDNLISTNYYMPYNKGRSMVNTFNWEETIWKVRFAEGVGDVEDEVFSPFYTSDPAKKGIAAQFDDFGAYLGGEDYLSVEGWELLKANLGYNANGTVRNVAPQYPYVLMYDRIGGVLRLFVYAKNEGEANQLTASLGIEGDDYTPLLWGSLQQFKTLDEVQYGEYSKAVKFYGSSGRQWYLYDFIMEYDPCAQFFESSIVVKLSKSTRGTLSLAGRLEGASLGAGTDEYTSWMDHRDDFLMGVMNTSYGDLANTLGDISMNQYEDFSLQEFQTEISGTLEGAEIPDWQKQQAKLEWEAQALVADQEESDREEAAEKQLVEGGIGTFAGAVGGLAIATGNPQFAGGLATAINALGNGVYNIVKGIDKMDDESELPSRKLAYAKKMYYDNIKDKVKDADQDIHLPVPPPRPHAVFGELALKGTLEITTELIEGEHLATPAAINSYRAPEWKLAGSLGSAPLYNKPLGRFTMLNQPRFAVAIARNGENYAAYLKIAEKPYFASNDDVRGKITDIKKISINVQTATDEGIRNNMGEGYTLLFDGADLGALPGEMEITDLFDWENIQTSIVSEGLASESEVADYLTSITTVSYDVWSLTLTGLKSRSLKRVMNGSSQYFDGDLELAFEDVPGSVTGSTLRQQAQTLADAFEGYDFGDNEHFGTQYEISNLQNDFATVMYDYCTEIAGVEPNLDDYIELPEEEEEEPEEEPEEEEPEEEPQEEPAEEEVEEIEEKEQEIEDPVLDVTEASAQMLTVYPNPTSEIAHFVLPSDLDGLSTLILTNNQGVELIKTVRQLRSGQRLKGSINVSSLTTGIYHFVVVLPNGKTITESIIIE